jgi:hypothetical protein
MLGPQWKHSPRNYSDSAGKCYCRGTYDVLPELCWYSSRTNKFTLLCVANVMKIVKVLKLQKFRRYSIGNENFTLVEFVCRGRALKNVTYTYPQRQKKIFTQTKLHGFFSEKRLLIMLYSFDHVFPLCALTTLSRYFSFFVWILKIKYIYIYIYIHIPFSLPLCQGRGCISMLFT